MQTQKKTIFLATMLLSGFCSGHLLARTFYVAPAGNDAGEGAEAKPWRTIQMAASVARAGDTILVRDGVYKGHLYLRFSGEANEPIVLKNYPGEHPIFDGEGKGRIELQSEHGWQKAIGWITVGGFEVRNGWDGIKFYNAHNIVLRGNNIHDNLNQGILGNGHHVRIDGNIIAHNGFKADNQKSNKEHGIYCTVSDFVIVNNVIRSNRAYGIQVAGYPFKAESHAGPEFADAHRWFIRHNTIAFNQNRGGIVIWLAGATDCIVENNIFFRNAVTLDAGPAQGIDFVAPGGHDTIRNNLFFAPDRTSIGESSVDLLSAGNIERDPLFEDAKKFDFRLRKDSPAIDAAVAENPVSQDIEGTRRPQGNGADIGAYEYTPLNPKSAAKSKSLDERMAEFFVSLDGNDSWSGRRKEPDNGDGPFATISRARDAVRALPKSRTESRPVHVILRGGTYFLDEPLQLGPEDSGTEEAPVVYAAAPGEQVILSGGRRLPKGSWGDLRGRKVWTIEVQEAKTGAWRFRQLFVGGERRPRTRLPKQGEYQIESLPDVPITDEAWTKAVRRFVFAGKDIQRWHNLADVEIVAPCRWVDNRLPIQDLDLEKRIVTFDRSTVFNLVELYHTKPSTYWVENLLEALDTPGQWYLDRPAGKLYYLAKEGEDPGSAEFIAPRLPQVVRAIGRSDAPVQFLRFEGITFAHTEWQPPATWAASSQAAVDVPGAVYFTNATQCAVTNCRVEHVGTYGIEVAGGCADLEIARNHLSDLGGGGVKIGHDSHRTKVIDNEIAHGGRIFMSAVGVWVGHSAGNQIAHNEIHDLHYSGMSIGWQWDFKPSKAVTNLIEFNHIYDLGHGLLSDMGGIYTLGVSPGTRIRGNVIHDIKARAYGGWGIYPDEGSSEIIIESNLVYRCNSAPFFSHINRKIIVRNNIFAFGEQSQIERAGANGEVDHEYTFERNIIYYRQGQLVGYWDTKHRNFTVDHNLYWNTSGAPITFSGKSLSDWQAAGNDKNSLIADPTFIDAKHNNFRLRPESPALRLGFKQWDASKAGLRRPGE